MAALEAASEKFTPFIELPTICPLYLDFWNSPHSSNLVLAFLTCCFAFRLTWIVEIKGKWSEFKFAPKSL